MRNLIVEPEFRDKIPPLSAEEFAKLEENILADGEVREPLVCWNDTIIDGHHRWKIILRHPEIPYKVEQKEFQNKWYAIVWMCKNQLGRRNITAVQKTVLIAEAQRAQKMAHGGERGAKHDEETGRFTSSDQNGHLRADKTRVQIAKQFGVGAGTVQRAEEYLQGLEAADKVSPGIKDAFVSGEVKAPKQVIAGIRKLPEEKRPAAVEAIKRGEIKEAQRLTQPDKPFTPTPIATPIEQRPPYNLDDFREELLAIVKNADACFKQTLALAHREMLDTADGRETARDVLREAHEAISKYENMVKEVEKNESL